LTTSNKLTSNEFNNQREVKKATEKIRNRKAQLRMFYAGTFAIQFISI